MSRQRITGSTGRSADARPVTGSSRQRTSQARRHQPLDVDRAQRLGHKAWRAVVPSSARPNDVRRTTVAQSIGRQTRPAIQRLGEIVFANRDPGKYQSKATDVIAALRAAPKIQNFLANKTALITIENSPSGTPASVKVFGSQVQIQLAPWFFKQKSRGAILGMLAHEFGVHPVADENLTAHQLGNESTRATNRTPLATGHGARTIAKDNDNQADHVFGSVDGEPRYAEYRETAYDIVSAMITRKQAGIGTAITNDHITEAIYSYLADIASILATNDHRLKVLDDSELAAQYFNLERTRWLTYLTGRLLQNEITQRTPGIQTKNSVRKAVASLAVRRLAGMFGSPTDNTRSRLGTGAALTQNQQDLLTGLGMAVQPKPIGVAAPNFFQALDGPRGVAAGATQTTVRALFDNGRNQYRSNHPVGPREQAAATRLDGFINQIDNGKVDGKLSPDFVIEVANFLGAKIDIVEMNGKLDRDDLGANGPYTLLFVNSRTPHYRWAQ